MKLRTLKSSLRTLSTGPRPAPSLSDMRMAGRALQDRRLKLWTANPCCAECGRLTDYPQGFELDHRIPLEQGGPDTEENSQILCVHWDHQGKKQGCHAEKTKREAMGR